LKEKSPVIKYIFSFFSNSSSKLKKRKSASKVGLNDVWHNSVTRGAARRLLIDQGLIPLKILTGNSLWPFEMV
jgi:hypothetical protein